MFSDLLPRFFSFIFSRIPSIHSQIKIYFPFCFQLKNKRNLRNHVFSRTMKSKGKTRERNLQQFCHQPEIELLTCCLLWANFITFWAGKMQQHLLYHFYPKGRKIMRWNHRFFDYISLAWNHEVFSMLLLGYFWEVLLWIMTLHILQ